MAFGFGIRARSRPYTLCFRIPAYFLNLLTHRPVTARHLTQLLLNPQHVLLGAHCDNTHVLPEKYVKNAHRNTRNNELSNYCQ